MADKEYRSPINGQPLPEGRRFKSGEQASEAGKKGGKASAAKRAKLKTLREELEIMLSEVKADKNGKQMTIQASMTASLIKQALDGNTKAYEIIRDTIGQKPAEQIVVAQADYSALDEVNWDE